MLTHKAHLMAKDLMSEIRNMDTYNRTALCAAYKAESWAHHAVGADTASRGERWVLLRRAKA